MDDILDGNPFLIKSEPEALIINDEDGLLNNEVDEGNNFKISHLKDMFKSGNENVT